MDPRVLDTWDGVPARQPMQIFPGEFELRELVAGLTDPAVAGGVRLAEPPPGPSGRVARGPVWQCSLRNARNDRVLSDDEWREIARDLLHRTGIAPRGDSGACRWVMVRHAEDHVHVEAVLVREDTGRRFFPRNDYLRAGETCAWAEQTYELELTAPVDRTALPAVSRAEREKAARLTMEPSRVWLRRAVRTAAVQSQDPETFLTRLRRGGMLVRLRHDTEGQVVGYAVAQRGDTTADGEPVWYAGRSLARDLTLPQLQQRWASAPAPGPQLPPEPTEHATVGRAERTAALTNATTAAEAATRALAAGEGEGGGIAHAAGDLLVALGQVIPERAATAGLRNHLRGVAEVYDRAARTAGVGQPRIWSTPAQALRTTAWQLAAVGSITVTGSDAVAAAMLLAALAALAAEIAAYHAARARHVQAAAARRVQGELVATRPVDTRPGRSDGPTRPGMARRHPSGEPDTLGHRPATTTTRPPPQPGPPLPPPAPGQTPRPGRTR
ncbi:MAG TPA: hypothetical protein VGL88_06960 [Pseudonocardiaceae bacterium]